MTSQAVIDVLFAMVMANLQGIIVAWSGAIVDIPAGWVLCNGTGGTPDLRDRFIIGAGTTYDPDDTGGAVNHEHTFTGDGHAHGIPVGSGIQVGAGRASVTSTDPATGTTDNGSSLPPYYALAFIQKT